MSEVILFVFNMAAYKAMPLWAHVLVLCGLASLTYLAILLNSGVDRRGSCS